MTNRIFFGKEHRSTLINIDGAIESLKKLKENGHKLYLNSFCGKSRAIETKQAIQEQIPEVFEELFFVKNKDCKRYVTDMLGADVMIDDTLDVLQTIQGNHTCPHLIWFVEECESQDGIIMCNSWKEIVEYCTALAQKTLSDEKCTRPIIVEKIKYCVIKK